MLCANGGVAITLDAKARYKNRLIVIDFILQPLINHTF